jgi:hypothetical protein
MPAIKLRSEHQTIEYAPVHFQTTDTELWLPASAEIYFDFRNHKYHRVHSLSPSPQLQFLLAVLRERQRENRNAQTMGCREITSPAMLWSRQDGVGPSPPKGFGPIAPLAPPRGFQKWMPSLKGSKQCVRGRKARGSSSTLFPRRELKTGWSMWSPGAGLAAAHMSLKADTRSKPSCRFGARGTLR